MSGENGRTVEAPSRQRWAPEPVRPADTGKSPATSRSGPRHESGTFTKAHASGPRTGGPHCPANLGGRPARAIVVGRQPRLRPGVHDGGHKGTLSDPPVRGNALPRGCGPSKSTIHTSQTSTWHTQTEAPLLHPDIANQLQFAISKQACQPQVAESIARRGRLPDGSRGSTTGRGCSPSVEANHASHNGYYLPYCSNY